MSYWAMLLPMEKEGGLTVKILVAESVRRTPILEQCLGEMGATKINSTC